MWILIVKEKVFVQNVLEYKARNIYYYGKSGLKVGSN